MSLDGLKYSVYATLCSLVDDVLTNVLFEYAGCDGKSSSLEEPDKVVTHHGSHVVQALVPDRLKGVDVDVYWVVFGHGGFGRNPERVRVHSNPNLNFLYLYVLTYGYYSQGRLSNHSLISGCVVSLVMKVAPACLSLGN